MNIKWRKLVLLALAELLGMAVWFSASAVVPALTAAWGLNDAGRAWLTMSVQLGFVVGALGSALLNLADRVPARRLFAASALLAALATASIPLLATGLTLALSLRFLTGLFLAGVYPVGMKIMATWTKEDRGLGIGLLGLCLIWGLTVVADSAQFSAAMSELCRSEYVGTALTVQTSLGFLLTLVTIRLIPSLERWVGWERTFAVLAIGPAVGIWAMYALRRLPAAARLAGDKG